jgi:hypothetical protein
VRGEGILASYYAQAAKKKISEFRGLDQACATVRGANFGKLLRSLSQIFFGEFRGLDQACVVREFWQVITRAQQKKNWRILRAGPSMRGEGILASYYPRSAKKNLANSAGWTKRARGEGNSSPRSVPWVPSCEATALICRCLQAARTRCR